MSVTCDEIRGKSLNSQPFSLIALPYSSWVCLLIVCGKNQRQSKDNQKITGNWVCDLVVKGGAEVRALTSHQCDPGSNSGIDAIFGLSWLVLSFAPRGFSPGTPVFPSPQKPIWQWKVKTLFLQRCALRKFPMTGGQNTRDQITRGRSSKYAWSNCVLSIPFILRGSPNECWLHTSDRCVIKTWIRSAGSS